MSDDEVHQNEQEERHLEFEEPFDEEQDAFHQIQMNKKPRGQPIHVKSRRRKVYSYRKDDRV